jgi:hypothetical protein
MERRTASRIEQRNEMARLAPNTQSRTRTGLDVISI